MSPRSIRPQGNHAEKHHISADFLEPVSSIISEPKMGPKPFPTSLNRLKTAAADPLDDGSLALIRMEGRMEPGALRRHAPIQAMA
mmetsp:Transcript_33344/g.131405  ORF Transcript_33344/g.131405 Transcript_33344/m.131405 type:complete len:85 (-) Transcript_33344:1984-2238(-)